MEAFKDTLPMALNAECSYVSQVSLHVCDSVSVKDLLGANCSPESAVYLLPL